MLCKPLTPNIPHWTSELLCCSIEVIKLWSIACGFCWATLEVRKVVSGCFLFQSSSLPNMSLCTLRSKRSVHGCESCSFSLSVPPSHTHHLICQREWREGEWERTPLQKQDAAHIWPPASEWDVCHSLTSCFTSTSRCDHACVRPKEVDGCVHNINAATGRKTGKWIPLHC